MIQTERDIRTEWVELQVSDGTAMRAYTARPNEGEICPGLLILQEAFGVNAHIREVTERFAAYGYRTIAPELFHRTGAGFEGAYDNFEPVREHMMALKDPQMEADIRAAHEWLKRENAPTSSIGFCMGGRASFLSALTVPVKCAVSFYGGGIAPSQMNPGLLGRVNELKAPVLMFWGGLDRHIGSDAIRAVEDALKGAGKEYTNVVFSNADHGFFCDARPAYNPEAASEALALTLDFLAIHTRG